MPASRLPATEQIELVGPGLSNVSVFLTVSPVLPWMWMSSSLTVKL